MKIPDAQAIQITQHASGELQYICAIQLLITIVDSQENKLIDICEPVKNVGSARSKVLMDTLRLSASYNGCYSLAANQIQMPLRMFTMHNDVKDDVWLYPAVGKNTFLYALLISFSWQN